MSELAYLSWLDAAKQIRTGELSPVAYTEALLERIARHDGNLNTFIAVAADQAMAAAEAAQRDVSNGADLGPLHGVPFALKDIFDVAGFATTAHSKILAHNVVDTDAAVTTRLKKAGGIFLGKLATNEFAIGGPCFDLPWPPARNPWDRNRFTGGSSTGSGAALAAGFVPVALGTDTAGSVRSPASMCGVVGMKPTYGLVSKHGVVPLSQSLDTVGPMTRTVAENAALLNIIAGYDAADPGSASFNEAPPDFSRDLDAGIKGIRIGVIRHFYLEDLVAEAQTAAGIDAALEVLESLGGTLTDIRTEALGDFATCNRVILECEAFAVHEAWLKSRPEDYGALTRERLLAGGFYRAVDYIQAQRMRRQLTTAMFTAMADVDVVVTLSNFDLTPRIDEPQEIAHSYPRQARAPFNLTGQPTIAVPCGFCSAGMPLSLQIAGHPFCESMVYRVANAYELATCWTDRHPHLA